MAKSRELKRRIRAVGNIRRITKTMQMIATARFQASLKRASAAKPYTQKIAELVGELASSASGQVSHPLLGAGRTPTGKILLLVITSNRGLCGAYNGNILRNVSNFYKERTAAGEKIDLQVVGKKGAAYFRFMNIPVAAQHSQFTDSPSFESVEALAQSYMDAFAKGEYDAVHVSFMSFISASRQTPRVAKLLPMENPNAADKAGAAKSAGTLPNEGAEYDYSPDAATLLAELLPVTVKTQLFQWFNESVVSEQIARMVAMKSATDAAGKMNKDLSRKYNRARQASITTELSEIIAGAASLE